MYARVRTSVCTRVLLRACARARARARARVCVCVCERGECTHLMALVGAPGTYIREPYIIYCYYMINVINHVRRQVLFQL